MKSGLRCSFISNWSIVYIVYYGQGYTSVGGLDFACLYGFIILGKNSTCLKMRQKQSAFGVIKTSGLRMFLYLFAQSG